MTKIHYSIKERYMMRNAMKVLSRVLFSFRERKSAAESFLKFKQNVEFPTGAVRAKFSCIVDLGAWLSI